MNRSEQYQRGLEIRRNTLGAAGVDKAMADADPFQMTFHELATEWCWGYAWTRPTLSLRQRSMLNLAMLAALNRAEFARHVKGAITNGVTVAEIEEILLQVSVYCGVATGGDAFLSAHAVLSEIGALPASE